MPELEVQNMMEDFKTFTNSPVFSNEDNRYGYNCAFIVCPNGCSKYIYDKKTNCYNECGKCLISYNCNHGGTNEFNEFVKSKNCKVEWLNCSQLGVFFK